MQRPQLGDTLKTTDESAEVLRFLSERRSNLAKVMDGEAGGPDAAQLEQILQLSCRVPDHRKLAPYRFVTFTGDARAKFGQLLERRYAAENPDCGQQHIDYERTRFLRAHTVVAVISSPVTCPKGTPEWEQVLTSGAVCFQMLLAARAMGFAAQWLSEWYAYDAEVKAELKMGSREQIAGFMYIGAATEPPKERARPDIGPKVRAYS